MPAIGRKRAASRAEARPRRVSAGDIVPPGSPAAVERRVVADRVQAKTLAEAAARADPANRKAAKYTPLRKIKDASRGGNGANLEEELAPDWRSGGYPYKYLMSRKSYEKQKYRLQVELLKLQQWIKKSGQKVVVLFEGRDAAGKGGVIKRITQRVNQGGRIVGPDRA